VSRIVGPYAEDGLYGLGGVSFRAPPGSRARFGTARTGTFGRAVSRFEVLYLAQPGGGRMQLSVDGRPVELIDTAPSGRQSPPRVRVPTARRHEVMTTSARRARSGGHGADGPGVVLDAIGIQAPASASGPCRTTRTGPSSPLAAPRSCSSTSSGANRVATGSPTPWSSTTGDELVLERKRPPGAGCRSSGHDRAGSAEKRATTKPSAGHRRGAAPRAAEVGCAFFEHLCGDGRRGSKAPGSARPWPCRSDAPDGQRLRGSQLDLPRLMQGFKPTSPP
jgi:hypothetical protein